MVAPAAGFCGGTLYRPKIEIGEDQKKKVFAAKRVGFQFESV